MYVFEINARAFGGLTVEIDADNEGMVDARFASSGNDLPRSMYTRLQNSWYDMEAVNEEIANARYEDA